MTDNDPETEPVTCSRCGEEADASDESITSTADQWQCPCCGSWEDR